MTYELDLLIAVAFLAPVALFAVLEILMARTRFDSGRWLPAAEVVYLPPAAKPEGDAAANDDDAGQEKQAA